MFAGAPEVTVTRAEASEEARGFSSQVLVSTVLTRTSGRRIFQDKTVGTHYTGIRRDTGIRRAL